MFFSSVPLSFWMVLRGVMVYEPSGAVPAQEEKMRPCILRLVAFEDACATARTNTRGEDSWTSSSGSKKLKACLVWEHQRGHQWNKTSERVQRKKYEQEMTLRKIPHPTGINHAQWNYPVPAVTPHLHPSALPIISLLHISRRKSLDHTRTIHEPCPEDPVRVREHAIL